MLDAVFIFLLSTGGPAEPLDTAGGTLRFHGTLVEKPTYMNIQRTQANLELGVHQISKYKAKEHYLLSIPGNWQRPTVLCTVGDHSSRLLYNALQH